MGRGKRKRQKQRAASKTIDDLATTSQNSSEGANLQRESNKISRRTLILSSALTVAGGTSALFFTARSDIREQAIFEHEFPAKDGPGLKVVDASYECRSTTYASDQVLPIESFKNIQLGSTGGSVVQRELDMTAVGRGLLAVTVESRRWQTVITGIRAEVVRLGDAPRGTVYQTLPEGGTEEEDGILKAGIIASNPNPRVRVLNEESLESLGKIELRGDFPDVQVNLKAFESRTIRVYISCQQGCYILRMWLNILADGERQEVSITDTVDPVRTAGLAKSYRNIFKEDLVSNNRSVRTATLSEIEEWIPK